MHFLKFPGTSVHKFLTVPSAEPEYTVCAFSSQLLYNFPPKSLYISQFHEHGEAWSILVHLLTLGV